MKTHLTLILALAAAVPAMPQNPPPAATGAVAPNAAGVSFLHIHVFARNVDAQRNFWLALAGGPQTGRGVRIGTTTISITKGEPKGGNAGSAIESVTFRVKDLEDTLTKLEAAGGKRIPGGSSPVFLLAPEDVKVGLIEDRGLAGPPAYDYVELNLKSTAEILPWHRKLFGAEPARDGWTIPGSAIKVNQGKVAPTSKGTSLDHVAFEVGDLAAFMKKLDAARVPYEPLTRIGDGTRGYTYVMDPGGFYIELMGSVPAAQ